MKKKTERKKNKLFSCGIENAEEKKSKRSEQEVCVCLYVRKCLKALKNKKDIFPVHFKLLLAFPLVRVFAS